MPAFERPEYIDRITKVKARMEHLGIEVLLVINQSNMYYLTGYEGRSDYVPQMLILTLEDEEPKLILRKQDVPCAVHSTFLKPRNIIGYPEDYIGTERRHPHEFMAQLFKDWGIDKRRLGIERSNAPISPTGWDRLKAAMPNANFIEAAGLVAWHRLKKSPAELVYMRQAAAIADIAMQTAIDAIAPGVRECDVGAKVMAAQCMGTPDFGGDPPRPPAMPSGKKTSAPHLSWSDEVYRPNQPINIELGGFRRRYVAGLSRAIHIGEPPGRLRALHEATLEGMSTALETARSGRICEEVEAAFRATTRRHGFEKNSRIGYAIGIDWAENTASFHPGDRTVLEPDMTFHLMLGMWYDDWGYVLSETFRITDAGGETLAKLPRKLFVK
jgi:ectoine hydrolase